MKTIKNIFYNDYFVKIILINFTIIVILPFNLLINEKNNGINIIKLDVLFSYLFFFLIITFLSIIIFKLVNLITLKINKIINYIFLIFISFLFIWILLNGIFLPVVGEHDAFFNLKYSIRLRYILILKLIFVLILLFFYEKIKIKRKILNFFLIYLTLNFFYLIGLILIKQNPQTYNSNLNSFGKKNLIVLSLDGISGLKIHKEITLNNEFNEMLKDFKLYKNVTSAWPATVHSINTELHEKVINMTPSNLEKNILNDQNINVAAYGVYGRFINNKKNVVDRLNYKDYGRAHNVNNFFQMYFIASLGRWGTPYIINLTKPVFYSSFYRYFVKLISLDFSNKNNLYDENTFTSYNIQSPEFDLIFNDTIFDKNLDQVIRMYHFSFSHWPVKINQNCKEVKFLKEKKTIQEEIILKCLINKIEIFFDNLKDNSIYNNSLIIIKSDHAKPNGFYDEYPNNLKINNTIYWGLGRYKPFILIKDINEKKNNIEISDKHVFLADLAITYCNFFYEDKFCNEKYNYNNLLMNENSFKKNNYEIYIPQDEYSFIDMKDFKKYIISNDVSLEESLKKLDITLN